MYSFDQDSGFPCFKGGPRTILNLRKRFHLSLTEEVSQLIFRFLSFPEGSYYDLMMVAAMRIVGALIDQ